MFPLGFPQLRGSQLLFFRRTDGVVSATVCRRSQRRRRERHHATVLEPRHESLFAFHRATPSGALSTAVRPSASSVKAWPAPGSEDTELGVILEPEVVYGTQTLCTRVQA